MVRSESGQRSEQPGIALLSGAASDIGRATAERLAREGRAVILCGDGRRPLDGVLTKVRDLDGRGLTIKADVTDETEVQAAIARAVEWGGRVDALVNCVGIDVGHPWNKADGNEWEGHLRANLTSVFLWCRAVTPYMRMHRYGKIVNVASSAVALGVCVDVTNSEHVNRTVGVIAEHCQRRGCVRSDRWSQNGGSEFSRRRRWGGLRVQRRSGISRSFLRQMIQAM